MITYAVFAIDNVYPLALKATLFLKVTESDTKTLL